MSIWYWVAGPVYAHWRRFLLPGGIALGTWGNGLYSAHPAPSGLAVIGGLVLALKGMRSWKGFTKGWRLSPARIRSRLIAVFNTNKWVSRWGALKILVWGVIAFKLFMYPLNVSDRIVAAPGQLSDHDRNAQMMLMFYALFPLFTRWVEPEDDLLERLEWRAWRAMISRTLANFNGASGLAVLLYAELSMLSHGKLAVPPAMLLTIGVATIAATLKMWARYRKLCTQTHTDIQTLIRALENPAPWSPDHQQAVLAAWDAVERDLMTRTDTGYAFGTRFAPKAVTAALACDVEKTVRELPGHAQEHEDALAALKIIQSSCVQRIDAVA
jgi:hypothetical protein